MTKLITFGSRESNLRALDKIGEAVAGNPFKRKLKTGKIITVKGRLRKALRKELIQTKARTSTGRLTTSYDKPVSRELINRRRTHGVSRFVGDRDRLAKSARYNEITVDPTRTATRAVRNKDLEDTFDDNASQQHMGYRRINGYIPEPLYEPKKFPLLASPDESNIYTRLNGGLNRWSPDSPRHNPARYYRVREILGRLYTPRDHL